MTSSILVYLPLLISLIIAVLICVYKKLDQTQAILKTFGIALGISVISMSLLKYESNQSFIALKESCATAPSSSDLKGYVSTCIKQQNLTMAQKLIHRDTLSKVSSAAAETLKQAYVYQLAYNSAEAQFNKKLLEAHGIYPDSQEGNRLTVAYDALESNNNWIKNSYGELLHNKETDRLFTSYLYNNKLTEAQLQHAKEFNQRVQRIQQELPAVHKELKNACRHVEEACLEAFSQIVKIDQYAKLYQDSKFQGYIQQQLAYRVAQFEQVNYHPDTQ
jgi:hypothetical protein